MTTELEREWRDKARTRAEDGSWELWSEVFAREAVEHTRALIRAEKAEKELDAVSKAIGSVRWMDPPDGGSVSLGEQVRRMREDLDAAERFCNWIKGDGNMSKQLFNNPEGRRGSADIRMEMHELYKIIRDRLEWVKGDFDPDAVCQNICVEVEKHQGTYPNIPGSSSDVG